MKESKDFSEIKPHKSEAMEGPVNLEKKCPHCGEWTLWTGDMNDKCTHCHEELLKEENQALKVKEEKMRKLEYNFKEKFPFVVKEDDNMAVKAIKQVGYGIYFIFMSIMVTLLWIIFWLAS